MGLCFGKPCAESSAPVTHSSPVPLAHKTSPSPLHDHHKVFKPGAGADDGRRALPPSIADRGTRLPLQDFEDFDARRHTFRDLLSKKAEQAFSPIPAPSRGDPGGLPSSITAGKAANHHWQERNDKKVSPRSPQVLPLRMQRRDQEELKKFSSELQRANAAPLRHHLRDYDDELPVFDNSGEEHEEEEQEDLVVENGESFSSCRGATTISSSTQENPKAMIAGAAGNGTPVIPKITAYVSISGSSSEIIEETGSESSLANSAKMRVAYGHHNKKRGLSMESSCRSSNSSSKQDVVSLEFLDEFCRISEVTSHSSSCSEAYLKENPGASKVVVMPVDAGDMFSCIRARQRLASSSSSEEQENRGERRADISFLEFLCSQAQAGTNGGGGNTSKTESLSGSPGSSKKRPSTSSSNSMSESTTKKPRVGDELNARMEILKLCSPPGSTEAKPAAGRTQSFEEEKLSMPYLKRVLDSRRDGKPRLVYDTRSPPSTPGSFRSTPFASVGSSFSMDDFNTRRSLSPCTPPSASFTSAGALSPEEMTAIWNAFQEAQLAQ
ncbi:hypothetical protein SELMODRAFT_402946 [Selaginella moellendorffii]|uniref:Uncharacterized protein n=1 Tax=Selaginella moellendorffii TaxID=88036 RepID=D8QNJ5_SELML|nr:hypothetical protein SELMODRAFT_402946 [Selaginella moellendorffii]